MKHKHLDEFTTAYIECALWSSTDPDDDDQPLDENYSVDDLSPATLDVIIADCSKFQAENEVALAQVYGVTGPYGKKPCSPAKAGHDFWLTRNRHGVGFWDGDYPEPQDKILTDVAHKFGECNLYVDSGKVYML